MLSIRIFIALFEIAVLNLFSPEESGKQIV